MSYPSIINAAMYKQKGVEQWL